MLDFLMISVRSKKNLYEIYPKFIIKKSNDLMIRGGDFYAIWKEEERQWSTDEQDALVLIDQELDAYAEEKFRNLDKSCYKVLHMWDSENRMIDAWHRYIQRDMRDYFKMLDEEIIFSNTPSKKTNYSSKKLSYPLEAGDITAYEELISTLYSPEERRKIEWAIGAIVTGDSKKIQKFLVLYGAGGTGKSTILNIIAEMFDGYVSTFDARELGSASNAFALEAFKSNPLVAIQQDGDLSRIEDNTKLNSLVSHETMMVNEKFKSTYSNRFKAFLFMGTNKPVRITDAKSGLIRRLIDVSPTGNKIEFKRYSTLNKQIRYEFGAIAEHCKNVYLEDPEYYDTYVPTAMMGASNDFYNYIEDNYLIFSKQDGMSLDQAWELYKNYCEQARVPYPMAKRAFKEELKNYFDQHEDRVTLSNGERVRNYYSNFKREIFEMVETVKPVKKVKKETATIQFEEQESIFDKECSDFYAQYSKEDGTPNKSWDSVTTKLSEIDTHKLHYVLISDLHHIVIDFDIPDENGNKCFEKNLEAASKWPATYAELSKSGQGIHLHYIYSGDPEKLAAVYEDHVEIKVFKGKSSLRRKLTKCNNLPIATISSGLPFKKEKKVNVEVLNNEKALMDKIEANLQKKIHPYTKPSVLYIESLLNEAYDSGIHYDVRPMHNAILAFAAHSTNNADFCIKAVSRMKFCSDDVLAEENVTDESKPIVIFDCEVAINVLMINYKEYGQGKPISRMINPTPEEVFELVNKNRLIGFNNLRYDNHILYARMMGEDNEQIYRLSQALISGTNHEAGFRNSVTVSYADIYDFCDIKQSLKKWEIQLGIKHKELGMRWDIPWPEDKWPEISAYCDNDVLATEAVFDANQPAFIARQILAEIAGMTVNDTTNNLTTRIIFGKNRTPQEEFNYRFMGDESKICDNFKITDDGDIFKDYGIDEYTRFDTQGRPIFPGYTFEFGKSIYRGEEVGEGGYVYAEPGIYYNVALLDIMSMHPHSIMAEELFGSYTQGFRDLVNLRILIKHKEYEKAKTLWGGRLAKYLDDPDTAKKLSSALKIAINSVYGLTSAKFTNPFKDSRNVDNIVAKRGALFMINLKHEVQKRGFTVAHIKTDSIKIPNATPEIIQFVMDYGKMYGYIFEHEDTYKKMCLVNDAVYIAYDDEGWTATGAQFAVPYVFKTLFSGEPIEFKDLCEAKSVKTALYLDMNEDKPDPTQWEKELFVITKGNREPERQEELKELISKAHDYRFVGKVGLFCPIVPGAGGGLLMREILKPDGSVGYNYAVGCRGYRWLESSDVQGTDKEQKIDRSYYQHLVDEAIETINEYGDAEAFRAV